MQRAAAMSVFEARHLVPDSTRPDDQVDTGLCLAAIWIAVYHRENDDRMLRGR
jgi:hypothetical protein